MKTLEDLARRLETQSCRIYDASTTDYHVYVLAKKADGTYSVDTEDMYGEKRTYPTLLEAVLAFLDKGCSFI